MPNSVKLKNPPPIKQRKLKFVRRKKFAEQDAPKGFFRRVLRFIFNPITVGLATLFILGLFIILAYFWVDYSDKIDALLRGEVFTRTAGIYSAPKILKQSEQISPDDLIKYLRSAGYIEKNLQADNSRSRYKLDGDTLEIEPGATANIDDQKVYQAVRVKFDKNGKAVSSIVEKSAGANVKETILEPKILSSIAAEGDGRRKAVTFKDLPPQLVKAIVVTEDRSFFEHYGVNFRGIARALWRRYEGDENSPLANQGGSSITQQLVKNLLLSNDPTLERKVKEAYMSVILETRLAKEDIFTLYANQIYLGQQAGIGIYGVGEAANAYFGKDVSALSLAESAFIAGIIRSPNRYNPYKNQEKVTERRNQVLASMVEAGEITAEQRDQSKAEPINLVAVKSREDLIDMPYFTQFAEDELSKTISDPEALQHLRVYTTIEPDLQRVAYEALKTRVEKLEKRFPKQAAGNLQAALVAIRPKTGEIVAMVGGRDYLQNQFNRATSAQRQPGSVFKPFVYATAINSVYDPGSRLFTTATIFKDEKQTFMVGNEAYSPNNYGDVFSNKELTLRDALVKSKNTITVQLGVELNIGRVMNLAARAGFPKVEKAYPSMALGTAEATPLQVASAYTIFANLGEKTSPIAINRITTGDGRRVAAPVTEKSRVIQPDVAYIVDDILKDVINRGTATDAQAWGLKNAAGKTAIAGKTGTSRDGWFVGFTPELICAVYVGFDNGDDLGMKGSDSALPIWADFMREALNRHPDWNGDWQMPANIQKAEIDIRNGTVVRELNASDAQTAQSLNKKDKSLQTSKVNMDVPDATEVSGEFRRVELFINGTLPLSVAPVTNGLEANSTPYPTQTPFMTWQEEQTKNNSQTPDESPDSKNIEPYPREPSQPPKNGQKITVMICADSEMRATKYCPTKELKTFDAGSEPKKFCSLHQKQESSISRKDTDQ